MFARLRQAMIRRRPIAPPADRAKAQDLRALLDSLASEPAEAYLVRTGPDAGAITADPTGIAEIEINDSCNLDCVMCKTSLARRPKALMDLGLFEETVAWLAERGFTATTLHTIGDPLANKRLGDYLAILRRYKIGVASLSSNCLLLDRHLDTVFEYRDVIARLRPSLDAASKGVYESIRLGGSWEVLHRNLLAFAKRNAEAPNPFPVKVSNIISADNYHELAFIPAVFSYLAEPRQFLFSFINSLAPDGAYFATKSVIGPPLSNRPCWLPFRSAYILKEGTLSLCCRDYHGELVFGTVADWKRGDDSLLNLHRQRIRTIRSAHVEGDTAALPDLCRNCFIVDPRYDAIIACVFSHFFERVKGHPARLQDFLNRSLPALKAGDHARYWSMFESL